LVARAREKERGREREREGGREEGGGGREEGEREGEKGKHTHTYTHTHTHTHTLTQTFDEGDKLQRRARANTESFQPLPNLRRACAAGARVKKQGAVDRCIVAIISFYAAHQLFPQVAAGETADTDARQCPALAKTQAGNT